MVDQFSDPTTTKLLDYGQSMRPEVIPQAVDTRARELLLDSLGNAAAGSRTGALRIFRSYARPTLDLGVSLIGATEVTRLEDAVLLNGTAMRVQDFNDAYLAEDSAGDACHLQDVHSATLAVSAIEKLSVADVVFANVLAYEVMAAACEAYAVHARTLFDQSIYTAIAATMAVANLIDLDRRQTSSALGIAVASNLGLGQTRRGSLSMWKSAQVPYAAKAAVEACFFARAGVTGPNEIFAGTHGLLAALGCSDNCELELDSTEGNFRMLRGAIKKFPANYLSQGAIEAAITCHHDLDLTQTSSIRSVRVRTFEFALSQLDAEKFAPTTRETADHSSPYLIAVALRFGSVREEHYGREFLCDSELRELMQKICFEVKRTNPDRRYPESLSTSVEVLLDDGRRAIAEVDIPAGHSRRPFSYAELLGKFHAQSESVWSPQRQQQIEQFVLKGDAQSPVSELDELLRAM
jgi:2-methylcitrate dehydratase